jgi:uncharacterized phage protein gp47/JayE
LFEIGAEVIRQRAVRIDPAQIETDGSDVNIMLASEAAMAEEVMRQLALAEGRLLLDVASGEDLDRYAWDRYQITRKGAAAALGTVEFSRVSATVGAGTIGLGTLLRTDTGIQYKTLASISFGALDVGPLSVNVQAVQAGKETQVAEGAINAFVSPPFDPTIVVTNPDATAGGEPRESDALFRERVRDFFRTARRGILAAIEFGARAVPGVVSAKAIEITDDLGIPQRFVDLFIADSDGVASTALAALVSISLEEFRAGGIFVRVNTSIPIFVVVTLRLRFTAGVDTLTLTEQVRTAVLAFVNNLGTQQTLYVADLFTVLNRFVPNGLVVESDAIVAPVGDLLAGTGETIRTTLDRVTVE